MQQFIQSISTHDLFMFYLLFLVGAGIAGFAKQFQYWSERLSIYIVIPIGLYITLLLNVYGLGGAVATASTLFGFVLRFFFIRRLRDDY